MGSRRTEICSKLYKKKKRYISNEERGENNGEKIIGRLWFKVGNGAFINTGLKCVSIPPNVTTLATRAFGYTNSSTAVENFEIYAVPGSAGAAYASSNSFKNYKSAWSYDSAAKTLTIYGTGAMDLYLDGKGSLDSVGFIAAKVTDNTKDVPDILDAIKILKMS